MKRSKKSYKRPRILWDKQRIESERDVKEKYGLRRKKEIWKAETLLRKYRRLARSLAATKDKKMERELMNKLAKFGILEKGKGLDDVLSLGVEDILDRRLQTIVFQKGLANTPKQARQMIVHGHVKIDERRVPYPAYMVPEDEEGKIEVIEKDKPVPKKAPEKKVEKEEEVEKTEGEGEVKEPDKEPEEKSEEKVSEEKESE